MKASQVRAFLECWDVSEVGSARARTFLAGSVVESNHAHDNGAGVKHAKGAQGE